MPKHVLVALPLSDAQRSALQASVPEYEFTFAQTETVTLAQVLEADIIMGNVPVELICQNHHLEWFQSNFAGPDTYLVPGVLPEQCLVTNATGAYGLAILSLIHISASPSQNGTVRRPGGRCHAELPNAPARP